MNNLRLNVCLKNQLLLVVILTSYLMLHLPMMNIYKRRHSRKSIAHTIVLVVPSPTFRKYWILFISVWQNPDFFRSTEVNEANDNLVIETSDDILEDTNEKCFIICTLFQLPNTRVLGSICDWLAMFLVVQYFKESLSRVFQSHDSLSSIKPNCGPDNPSRSLNVC